MAAATATPAGALPPLRVVAFDGGWNLPIWAAQREGFFAAHGVAVSLSFTPNSVALVAGLIENRYDIAMAGFDNIVAYQEGQGEAETAAGADLFAFMGGDDGFLSVVTAPGVSDFDALRGGTLSVDAMTNGFAFVLRELVERGGLAESDVTYVRAGATRARYEDLLAGKHDGTLLRTPFELLAKARGCQVIATAAALGAYQGSVGAARRSWAGANEAALIGYMRGYRQALDWLCDPGNRAAAEGLLVAHIRDMTPGLAAESCTRLLAPEGGLFRDLALDLDGIRTVLALRSKFGRPHKRLTDPNPYIDLGPHARAFGPSSARAAWDRE
ncbi:MAG: ABC transporter substrate-binding protein [Betaproteobacteria bacterium]|nr:ABC transporter substrate-binding protein [Betaproteobacteria bacterium]MDE2208688.1 ABC transporter substrate-binding protein [Betaproteobacteria bacterium]